MYKNAVQVALLTVLPAIFLWSCHDPPQEASVTSEDSDEVQETETSQEAWAYEIAQTESVGAPRCIGDVCVGDSVVKYRDRLEDDIYMNPFGLIGILKDEGSFISGTEFDNKNVVYFTACEERGTILTINRVVKGQEFFSLLSAYEKRFGKSITPGYEPDGGYWREWKWPESALEIDLHIQTEHDSEFILIELHSRRLAGLENECIEQMNADMLDREGIIPD